MSWGRPRSIAARYGPFEAHLAGGLLLDELKRHGVALGCRHAGGVRQIGGRIDRFAQPGGNLRGAPAGAEALGAAAQSGRRPQVRMQRDTVVALLACIALVEVDPVRVPGDRAVAEQLEGSGRVLERWECVSHLVVDGHDDSCNGLRSTTVRWLRFRTAPCAEVKAFIVVTNTPRPGRGCFG